MIFFFEVKKKFMETFLLNEASKGIVCDDCIFVVYSNQIPEEICKKYDVLSSNEYKKTFKNQSAFTTLFYSLFDQFKWIRCLEKR